MQYRVVQIGIGNTGAHGLRAVVERPDLELIGVGVRSAEKAGRDAGELIDAAPVGVVATDDVASLIAMKPDCVSFMAGDFTHGVGRSAEPLVDLICDFLRAGIDVSSTTMSGWVYPPSIPPRYRAKLDDACDLGGSTFLASGIDPGFMNDALVLLLSGFSRRITSIRGQELLNYDTYLVDEVLFDKLGFGRTREGEAAHRPGSYAKAWAGVVEWIAGGLGVTLDEIVDARDAWYTPTPIEHAGWRIDADTVAAIRFEVRGIVGGEPRIVLEHVTRLARDAAPDWPQPPGHGGYRVEIDGIPAMRMEVALDEPGGDANIAALIATAQRAVNAIPVICEAPPGVKSWFDLPPVVGAHAFRV